MPLLSLQSIHKNYGGVKALININLDVREGEIHSIVGENGAGKSTMMKIISGLATPTSGNIAFEDQDRKFLNARDSEKLGIFIVHQEPMFFPELTVLENIFLGQEIKNKLGFIDTRKMKEKIIPYFSLMGVSIKFIDSIMHDLALGTQQLVLIIKGLYQKSKLLIFDEPTSILSFDESERLFSIIKQLSTNGVAILYISHRISEILNISDRVSVLKDGTLIKTIENKNLNSDDILSLMSGRTIKNYKGIKNIFTENMKTVLSVENLSSPQAFSNISFELKQGQILGLYGLIGAGRTEVAQAIIGERKYTGKIEFKDTPFRAKNIKDSFRKGIVYLPEDRITQGVFLIEKIRINMMSGLVSKLCKKNNLIDFNKEQDIIKEAIAKYSIKVNNVENFISTLSGGNQQKIIFSRCLLHNPEILILDEPTRGIDVKTKIEIYELIKMLSNEGKSIILISSELPEILALTNTVMVMYEGKFVDYFIEDTCTEQNVLRAALNSLD